MLQHSFLGQFFKKNVLLIGCLVLFAILSAFLPVQIAEAQEVSKGFANNPWTVDWEVKESQHFKIIYPERFQDLSKQAVALAEQIYSEYKKKLGVAPDYIITLYMNDEDEVISKSRSRETDLPGGIWKKNSYLQNASSGRSTLKYVLRYEIAGVFQEYIQSSNAGALKYLFGQPSASPWSDGFQAYLTVPFRTPYDTRWMRNFWCSQLANNEQIYWSKDLRDVMLGRSQINTIEWRFGKRVLPSLYQNREQALGGHIDYFDFYKSFNKSVGIPYDTFNRYWSHNVLLNYRREKKLSKKWNKGHVYAPLSLQGEVRKYLGMKVHQSGEQIAVIRLPASGYLLQQLAIVTSEGEPLALVDKGYFHPTVAWHPAEMKIVYSKRQYGKYGNYHYELFLGGEGSERNVQLTNNKHAIAPAFSPDGRRLAYISQKEGKSTIWIRNMSSGDSEKVYTFKNDQVAMHLSWHPSASQLLVSYQKNSAYKAAILHLRTSVLNPLDLDSAVRLHAQWKPDGEHIYFNGVKGGVSNIGIAEIKDGNILNKQVITAEFEGASLWDVSADSTGSIKLWAQSLQTHGRTSVSVYPVGHEEPDDSTLTFDPALLKSNRKDITGSSSQSDYSQILPHDYKQLANISLERIIALPYYVNTDDFGVAAYLDFSEPLQKHQFNFSGIISFPSLFDNSFFYTSYVNNTFKPRIRLSYSHLSASSDLLGLLNRSIQIETRDAVALSALWKLGWLSSGYSNWYAGVMVRHMAFDYFNKETMQQKYDDIIYDNTITGQTDLRLALSWRRLKPYRHTIIHPLDAHGVRLSATGSDDILGSKVEYLRLNLEGYTMVPTVGKHRIFLYANGVIDIGETAGRDYLNFADNADLKLPEPNFMGSIDPGIDRFIRGYTHTILGEEFLFGSIEYRIPWKLDSSKKLLGIIPPARTTVAFFMDAGVMGGARWDDNTTGTAYRYSTGAEIKRVFGFGDDLKLTYQLGVAQPLNREFAPQFYITIQSAIPF